MSEIRGFQRGVALGGGVARGFYLLGAWRALNEAGIRFDCFAGTSAGSLAAAAFAGDATAEEIEKMAQTVKWGQDVFNLKNTSLNWLSAIKGYVSSSSSKVPPGLLESSRIPDFINRIIGQKTFSAIRPLILTSTDIVTGERILFCSKPVAERLAASGKLKLSRPPAGTWQAAYEPQDVLVPFEDVGLAARASSCFPGVMSSVPVDCPDLDGNVSQRVLNDGGICEQAPVKPLKALGCEKVLAIFVGFLPWFREVNHLVAVAMNSIQYLIRHQATESLGLADYVLYDPRIEDTNIIKLDPRVVDMGYEFTKERIPEIVDALEIEGARG